MEVELTVSSPVNHNILNTVLGLNPLPKTFHAPLASRVLPGDWCMVIRSTEGLWYDNRFQTRSNFLTYKILKFGNFYLEQKETWDLSLHVQFPKNQNCTYQITLCSWKWWQNSHAWASSLLFSVIVVLSFTKRTREDMSP